MLLPASITKMLFILFFYIIINIIIQNVSYIILFSGYMLLIPSCQTLKKKQKKTFPQSQEVTLLFTLLSTSTFSLAQSSLKSFAVKCQLCDILNWYKNYTLLVVFLTNVIFLSSKCSKLHKIIQYVT